MADAKPLWQPGEPGELLLYRVNRRPIGADSMLPEEIPDDVLDHFNRVLPNGWKVETKGGGGNRIWRSGGVERDPGARVITGKLGWHPAEEEAVTDYDEQAEDWVTSIEAPHGRVVLPFAFDGDTRILAVLRMGRSRAATIGRVFETILKENECELERPTTDWSVEPILDPRDFKQWLESMDVVSEVQFVAKLPNPTPNDAYKDVFKRMEERRATRLIENIHSNRAAGLQNVQEDAEFRQAEAMASEGFATLKGVGERDGRKTRYNQNERVRRATINNLPGSWGEMRAVLTGFLKEQARGFLGDE
jgi:hypothetical protein